MPTLVEMKQIVKRFPGLVANDHIDFETQKGEIHGLLDEHQQPFLPLKKWIACLRC